MRWAWTEPVLRPSRLAISRSEAVPSNLSSARVHFLMYCGRSGGMPSAFLWRRTWSGVRRKRLASSQSFNLPRILISRAVQRRGAVCRPIRRCMRSAATSLMVRRKRRAKAESGALPSSFNSASVQGLPQRLFFGNRAFTVLKVPLVCRMQAVKARLLFHRQPRLFPRVHSAL